MNQQSDGKRALNQSQVDARPVSYYSSSRRRSVAVKKEGASIIFTFLTNVLSLKS